MVRKSETEENIKILKKVARTSKDKKFATKLLSIRLVFEGYTIDEAASIANCCPKTVYINLKRYEQGGITALHAKLIPGKPKKLTNAQEEELYKTIKNKLPLEVGFAPFVNWTSSLAVQWIGINYNVKFSDRGVRNVFERIGLSYTRPTYTLKKADPEKQAAFQNEFEQVKKTDF